MVRPDQTPARHCAGREGEQGSEGRLTLRGEGGEQGSEGRRTLLFAGNGRESIFKMKKPVCLNCAALSRLFTVAVRVFGAHSVSPSLLVSRSLHTTTLHKLLGAQEIIFYSNW